MNNSYKLLKQYFSSGRCNKQLREKVWRWMIHPTHQKEKEEALMLLWDNIENKADESTLNSYRHFKQTVSIKQHHPHPIFNYHQWSRIAAILLVPIMIISLTLLYQNLQQDPVEMVELFVPKGEQRKVILPDGSVVFLNAGSLLVYPTHFSKIDRSIYLLGEANFDVKKDKHHPFIVKTNHLQVKVLGTKFNLHAYPEDDKTTTTLESGSVLIQTNNKQELATLSPNEQLEYNHSSGKFDTKKIDATLYTSWTQGELIFAAMTLKEIFIRLERMYNIHVIIPPHLKTNDLYTIKFKEKAPLEKVINIITQTIGDIKYTLEDGNIILIKSH